VALTLRRHGGCGIRYRLPPNGYTQERLDEVIEISRWHDHASIDILIEYLRYSTSNTMLESCAARFSAS